MLVGGAEPVIVARELADFRATGKAVLHLHAPKLYTQAEAAAKALASRGIELPPIEATRPVGAGVGREVVLSFQMDMVCAYRVDGAFKASPKTGRRQLHCHRTGRENAHPLRKCRATCTMNVRRGSYRHQASAGPPT